MSNENPEQLANEQIGENIKFHRQQKSISLEELASHTEISERRLRGIERGEVSSDILELTLLSLALDVTIDQLGEGTGDIILSYYT